MLFRSLFLGYFLAVLSTTSLYACISDEEDEVAVHLPKKRRITSQNSSSNLSVPMSESKSTASLSFLSSYDSQEEKGSLKPLPNEIILSIFFHLDAESLKNFSLTASWARDLIEDERVHFLKKYLYKKLTFINNQILATAVNFLISVWDQNQPSSEIIDKIQRLEYTNRRALAISQLIDLYTPLKAGMDVAQLAEIYKQLFCEKDQPDNNFQKSRMILRHSAVFFTPNINPEGNATIIETLLQGDAAQIQAILQNADVLFRPDMHTSYERAKVIDMARYLEVEEIGLRAAAISQNADKLFLAPDRNGETFFTAAIIISALQANAIEIGLRSAAISQNASRLFIPNLSNVTYAGAIAISLHLEVDEINLFADVIARNVSRLVEINSDEIHLYLASLGSVT